MEELVEQGLAKSIGVSNFSGGLMLDLFRYAKIQPATLQIEHHPYLVQQPLVDLCHSRGVNVTAYSSFGPMSYVELDMQAAKDTPLLFENETIKSIADKHAKTPAQVLLRWATQRNVAVIPKSNNPDRLAANLDVCSFDLSQDEIKSISALDRNLRFNNPPSVSCRLGQTAFAPQLALGSGGSGRPLSIDCSLCLTCVVVERSCCSDLGCFTTSIHPTQYGIDQPIFA